MEKLYLDDELRGKMADLCYLRATEKFDQIKWLNEYYQNILSLITMEERGKK